MTAQSIDSIADMRTASGLEAMEYAEQHMPVLRDTMDDLTTRVDFSGIRIAVCPILEPKTAILLRKLKAAGAIVGVYCGRIPRIPEWRNSCAEKESRSNPAEPGPRNRRTRQPCACWTRYSRTSSSTMVPASPVSPRSNAPSSRRTSLEWPRKRPVALRAFQQMQEAGALTYPVVAVNDSVLKTGFDNAHGTGETCVTTMQRILGEHAFDGKNVTVIGYGPVGQGFARRIRALGAEVTICDIDPVASLKAVFDGFAAQDIDEALPCADMVVSATGVRHTVTLEHMRAMHEGAALAVIGGIANEIAFGRGKRLHPQVNRTPRNSLFPTGQRSR